MRAALAFSASLFACACGGSTITTTQGTPDASTSGDARTADVGTPPVGSPMGSLVAACPSSPPTLGASCDAVSGVTCEYGSDPDWACNTVSYCSSPATCMGLAACSKYTWQPLDVSPAQCPSHPFGAGPGCPATHAEAAAGGTCHKDGLVCSYPEGLCACSLSVGTWACATTNPACPPRRPRIGSACPKPNLTCDYGVCPGLPENSVFECSGPAGTRISGFWMAGLPFCPGSGK